MNTYLIVSETIYNITEKLKELKNGIENIITFNLDTNTMSEVLEEASYFSMFDTEKCIIVKNAKFFASSKTADSNKNKEDINKLLKYLEDENKNTRLIFILNGKADSKKKIYNIFKENKTLFIYPSLTKTDMKIELAKLAKKEGYSIEDNSLWYIINNSFGNFDLALNELKKIMTFYGSGTNIKYKDVLSLTAKTIEDNNFKIVDSIMNKDLDNSLKYLEELTILKVEPTIIFSLIYREYRLMLSVFLYEKNKYNHAEILQNLKLAEWQYNKVKDNLRRYNVNEVKSAIIRLSEIDYGYKSGLLARDTLLLTYILESCL